MQNKSLVKGIVLLVSFAAILVLIFMPIYGNDRNGLMFSDDFFNALAKGSSNFMDNMAKLAQTFVGREIAVDLKMATTEEARKVERLFAAAGAQVAMEETTLRIRGDLGRIMLQAVADARVMFDNQGEKLYGQYKYDAKGVLKHWWRSFGLLDKALKKDNLFNEAKAVDEIAKRALEPAYNFYGIVPAQVREKAGMLTFMLVFYVIYTLWFGYAIYELFEGLGLSAAKATVKKEV